jgi:peptide deformylase
MASGFIDLCREPLGKYKFAHALAHCQVDHDDPLRFFVTHDGRVIINPKIVDRGEEHIVENEACYSYPHRTPKKIKRLKEITVDYQYMNTEGEVFWKRNQVFEGLMARVFQHELGHFNGNAIY